LTKFPVSSWLTAICTVNAVLAGTVPKFFGVINFADGIAVVAGICPMGAGLHDPVLICVPLVIGWLVVAQKLIQLFVVVFDATWPAS